MSTKITVQIRNGNKHFKANKVKVSMYHLKELKLVVKLYKKSICNNIKALNIFHVTLFVSEIDIKNGHKTFCINNLYQAI